MSEIQYLHSALLVSNLDQAEHFYGTVLGLQRVERSLRFPGLWYQVGAVQIHLIQQEDYAASMQNSAKWGRNPHLALGVSDLAAIEVRLVAEGYAVQHSASGRAALFICDLDSNVVELSEIVGGDR